MKKLLSILLVLCISVSMLAGVSFAASEVASGTCGENLTWALDSDGTLTISGAGKMYDFNSYSRYAPWYGNRSSVKTVIIKDGVTSIGEYAFYWCDSLASIEIPNSIISIGESAFYWCDSLALIEIPNSVTSIGESAFYLCTALTTITVDTGNANYSSRDGNLYNKDQTTLIQYAIGKTDTSFAIPNSVTSIGDDAFYWCDSLVSIEIPNSVTSIGEYAFCICDSLASIEIPNSVTSIGGFAFNRCDSLTTITVDAGNANYSSRDGNLYNKDQTTLIQYAIGKTDTSFTIPNSVTSIGEYAFCYCDSLASIEIPDSITSVGGFAFYRCTALTDVYYGGTEEKRNGISISSNNNALTNATWHYTENFVLLSPVSGGVISFDKKTAVEGEIVTLTATPNVGYRFKTFLVDGVAIEGNTFVMPKNAVTVSAEFEAIDYAVTCEICENGSIASNKTIAGIDETVTITATPSAGYELSKVYVNGSVVSGTSFTMPAGDVTVTAEFVKKVYTITTEESAFGTITTNTSGATFGEAITVTATPNAGYRLAKIRVNGTAISGNIFVMPKSDITVSADFAAIDYAVSTGVCENGTVSVDKEIANVGDTITVTATADMGYKLSKLLINGSAITGTSFVMPAADVTVTAEYVKKLYSVQTVQSEDGIVMVDRSNATFGEIVTVTTVPGIGYTLLKTEVNGVEITGNQFVMPKEDVTVTAQFVLMSDVNLSTVNGAQIRTKGNQGLRFISTIDKTSADFDRVVEFGTILIPSADVTDISQFTIGATLNGHTVAKVPAKKLYSETDATITFTAVITDISERNYIREYTARAYAIMDDGSVIYSDTSVSRSVYMIANRGIENESESESNLLLFQKIVDTSLPYLYEIEYRELTDTYDSAIAQLQAELDALNTDLSTAYSKLNEAEQGLTNLPGERDGYISRRWTYYRNEGSAGSSYLAYEYAVSDWNSYYSSESRKYQTTIQEQENKIDELENSIYQNQNEQNRLTLKYSADVDALKGKYGK